MQDKSVRQRVRQFKNEEEKSRLMGQAQALYEQVNKLLRPEEGAQFVRYFLEDADGSEEAVLAPVEADLFSVDGGFV